MRTRATWIGLALMVVGRLLTDYVNPWFRLITDVGVVVLLVVTWRAIGKDL